ncbi:MAG TPA: condensation domain-containing protein, partial [Micromonosporaceae bacterium]|nr:condensation domain-containing protein [Micromonosporaceae bacterium]
MNDRRAALAARRAALSPAARAALADRLRGSGSTPAPDLPRPAGPESDAPLSFTQEQFWLRQQAFPDDTATNVFTSVRLLGHLDVAALTASCTELLSRHAVLRSRFVESGGQPRAVPGPATALRLRHADLSASGAPDRALAEAARAE